jgi:hypothetical protein
VVRVVTQGFSPAGFLVHDYLNANLYHMLIRYRSLNRHCYYMITLSLWRRRYDVYAPCLLVFAFQIFRSNGSGRLSNPLNPRLFSDPISKSPMAPAQICFLLQSLFCHSTAFVRHVKVFPTVMPITYPNNRIPNCLRSY